jgi:hypothetical protein
MNAHGKDALSRAIASAIAAIPARNHGIIDLYPTTLRDQLSRALIDRIAEVAAVTAIAFERAEIREG